MTIERLFYGYMVLVGAVIGGMLVAAPQIGDYFIKPYFWVLIAVALFEIATSLYRKYVAGPLMTMQTRMIGFTIGIVLMVAIPWLAGSPARFL